MILSYDREFINNLMCEMYDFGKFFYSEIVIWMDDVYCLVDEF